MTSRVSFPLGLCLGLAATTSALGQLKDQATPVDALKVAKGFKVELLYTVPKGDQGSWVSMCTDPKGRLIVSDQYGKLYRLTPPAIGTGGTLALRRSTFPWAWRRDFSTPSTAST